MNNGNGQNLFVIGSYCVSIFVGLFTLAGVIFTALTKKKTDDAALKSKEKFEEVTSSATVKVALINDRDTWEQRLIDVQKALDDKLLRMGEKVESLENALDREREQRRKLETALHTANLTVQTLQGEYEKANKELESLRSERIKRNQDCQEEITRLHDENVELKRQIASLRTEHDQLQAAYTSLERQVNQGIIG